MNQQKKLDIKGEILTDPKQLQGKYANFAMVKHTENEFIIDFALRIGPEAHFLTRIISSPQHAKALANALATNVSIYEKKFGAIKPKK